MTSLLAIDLGWDPRQLGIAVRLPLHLSGPCSVEHDGPRDAPARTMVRGDMETVAAALAAVGYVVVPCETTCGRDVRVRLADGRVVWDVQPPGDNYWVSAATLDDLLRKSGWSRADLRPIAATATRMMTADISRATRGPR